MIRWTDLYERNEDEQLAQWYKIWSLFSAVWFTEEPDSSTMQKSWTWMHACMVKASENSHVYLETIDWLIDNTNLG